MRRLVLVLLGIAAVVLGAVSYYQISDFRQREDKRLQAEREKNLQDLAPGEEAPAPPGPDVAAEKSRLAAGGMFWHYLPWIVWIVVGGGLVILGAALHFSGRRRRREAPLEVLSHVGERPSGRRSR